MPPPASADDTAGPLVPPPPVYSDELMAEMIDARFEQEIQRDAAIDVFIFRVFTQKYVSHGRRTPKIRRDWQGLPVPPSLDFTDPAFAVHQEELLQNLRAAGFLSAGHGSLEEMCASALGLGARLNDRYAHLYKCGAHTGGCFASFANPHSTVAVATNARESFQTTANLAMLMASKVVVPGEAWKEAKADDNCTAEEDHKPTDPLIKAKGTEKQETDPEVSSPSKLALAKLKTVIKRKHAANVFTCGGEVATGKVTVSFETALQDGKNMKMVEFPGARPDALRRLARTCHPATFDSQGTEVLDSTRHNALKLEASQFVTSFHPYDFGIVDVIQQILLPGHAGYISMGRPSITTELHQLNVYDQFCMCKAHVRSSRSDKQFGFLVVCLPCDFNGGELLVSHSERTIEYNWEQKNPVNIKWAAFYNDCKQEVLPVEHGYRCTLTYNLYFNTHQTDTIPAHPTFDVRTLPLYAELSEMLQTREFLPLGGVLGYYCEHAYAHTSSVYAPRVAVSLKGLDAAVCTVLRSLLGLTAVEVRPLYNVRTQNHSRHSAEAEQERLRAFQQTGGRGANINKSYTSANATPTAADNDDKDKDKAQEQGRTKARKVLVEKPEKEELKLTHIDQDEGCISRRELESVESRSVGLRARRTLQGITEPFSELLVGDSFLSVRTDAEGGPDLDSSVDLVRILTETVPVRKFLDCVHWINRPKNTNKELSLACMTYCDRDTSMECAYSRAVILATIPAFVDGRGKPSVRPATPAE